MNKHALTLALSMMVLGAHAQEINTTTDVAADSITITTDAKKPYPDHYWDDQQNKDKKANNATVIRHFRGESALTDEYLFGKDSYSKFYPTKKFLDRAMLDLGAGINFATARDGIGRRSMGTQSEFRIGLSDWVTPEHGWRITLGLGSLPISTWNGKQGWTGAYTSIDPSFYGIGADWLVNISALANRNYNVPKKLEFYGVAGIDANIIDYTDLSKKSHTSLSFGGHLGLRGIYNFTNTNYIYVEPHLNIYHPSDLLNPRVGDGYAVSGGITAGIGFRKDPRYVGMRSASERDTLSSIGNDWFLNTYGGVAFPFDDFAAMGPRIGVAVGKWLNRTSGLRVRFDAEAHRTHNAMPRAASLGFGADYMWNITRAFSNHPTYDRTQEPRFGINFLAGGSFNLSDINTAKRFSNFGVGFGFQFNYRIANMTDFYLEPRIDAYSKNFFPNFPTKNVDKLDIAATLAAGFTFHQGMHTEWLRRSNDNFESKSWLDNLFMQGGVGIHTPFATKAIRSKSEQYLIQPKGYLAVGRWITATHGIRVYGELGTLKQDPNMKRNYYGAVGADYLWNITNALAGYDEERYGKRNSFEFIATMGVVNGFITRKRGQLNPGLSFGLHTQYNITPTWSLYIEPQMRVFGKNYLANSGTNIDALASVMIGAQIRTQAFEIKRFDSSLTDESEETSTRAYDSRRTFYGVAGAYTFDLAHRHTGFAGRLSVGRWLTPVSAVRGNFTVTGFGKEPVRHRKRMVRYQFGADYLFDISNLLTGSRDHLFHFRPLVGVDLGFATYKFKKTQFDATIHAGAQAAFQIAKGTELYIEPQLTYLAKRKTPGRMRQLTPVIYIGFTHTMDPVADVLATAGKGIGHGVGTMFRNMHEKASAIREKNAKEHPWTDVDRLYNKMFFEFGGGPAMLWSRAARHDFKNYMGFGGYMGFGRWFNAQHGLRVRLTADRVFSPIYHADKTNTPWHNETMGLGLEYAFSISNAIWGYNPTRALDLNAYVGPHLTLVYKNTGVKLGGHLSVQGLWNISETYSLFLQPEIGIYGQNTLRKTSLNACINSNLSLGLQIHAKNFNYAEARRLFDETDGRNFFSVAAGACIPLRDIYSSNNRWGGTARISYGRWFAPMSAWRVNAEGWAFRHSTQNDKKSVRVGFGGDYLLDLTTMAFGFQQDRRFNLRAIAGFNLSLGYASQYTGRLLFQPDIHAGGQFSLRVSNNAELYLEPTASYVFGKTKVFSRLHHVYPNLLAGVNYRIHRHKKMLPENEREAAPAKKSFVTASIGTGCNTYTIISGCGLRRKFSIDANVTYGQWMDNYNGIRLGLFNSNFNTWSPYRNHPVGEKHRQNNISIHADYMLNLLSVFRGEYAKYSNMELAAFAGINYNFAIATGQSMKKGLGFEAGFQLGTKVSDAVSIFVEPVAQLTTNKLYHNSGHAIEGSGKVLFGVKYAF